MASDLFRRPVTHLVEERHAVGLRPQSNLSGVPESRVFDLEQLLTIGTDPKPGAVEFHPKAEPLVGWYGRLDTIAALPADDVEWAAHARNGLVEHDVVLEGVGADHIVVIGIAGAPHDAGRAILGAGNGLEHYLGEAVLNPGVILQEQGISRGTG